MPSLKEMWAHEEKERISTVDVRDVHLTKLGLTTGAHDS